MTFLIDPRTGEILGKDLVTGYANVPQRMSGVILSPPPRTSRKLPPDVGTGTHDPSREGGLLNGRKPKR